MPERSITCWLAPTSGEALFKDNGYRKLWLETLTEACRKTGWRIHAYVLMGNHHLLLETPEPNLSAGMKCFWSTYTSRFNRRHQLFGHLFQGLCKAVVVDGAEQVNAIPSRRRAAGTVRRAPSCAASSGGTNGDTPAPIFGHPRFILRRRSSWLRAGRE